MKTNNFTTPLFYQYKPINMSMNNLKKYRCNVCKWVYDPQEGDIKGSIPSGTPFEELPAEWVCPVCKAKKNKFSPL